ncbi:unnamed protein product [Brachionus calyciflorus]|uniref:Uncharacterized protein n=1 Tax=Brachionus calyciflorus TaxID=104777 RepID=A0A813SKQ8_9BILA|nr:unnamed protein product [Brachionus calyciflorus]
MPFYDYTSKKNLDSGASFYKKSINPELDNSKPLNNLNKNSNEYSFVSPPSNNQKALLPMNQNNLSQKIIQNMQQNPVLNNATAQPNSMVQYKLLAPPVPTQPVALQPVALGSNNEQKKKPETRNIFISTDDVEIANKGTQMDKDLIKTVSKSMNTDLSADQLQDKNEKQTVNYFNEGFRTYYDEQADVLGVMCFLCWANCCGRCNNICKGCRNTISCPVYCWVCFIIPIFIILIIGIIICVLFGSNVISV